MRLVLLKEIPDHADLRREWNDLVTRSPNPQVFYTYEWSLAVYRAYKETLLPLLFLGYEGEHLCGVAALACAPDGRQVSFLCATTGDYCDFVSPPQHMGEFVSSVLGELNSQKFRALTLTNLPADSASFAVLREASARHGYRLFARTAYDCAQVLLDRLPRQQNKPVLRRAKKLRRLLQAMGREVPVQLEHERSWNAIEPVLPEFTAAHLARFLATGRISNLARPERRIFLYELAKLLSESGWLNLTRMMRGQTAIAWNYGFEFKGTWFWYQPTFTTAMEKYSPGMCLLAKIVQEAADDPAITTVDLGLGAEDYKEVFANQSRRTLYLTLRASPAQHAREIGRYYAACLIKARPPVEKCVRAALARWQSITNRAHQQGVTATLGWCVRRVRDVLWLNEEVHFFDCRSAAATKPGRTMLVRLDLTVLARAVCQYAEDESTCAYLLRAAGRLRNRDAEGFALLDEAGTFLHFAWITSFAGFYLSELNAKVESPSPDSVLLFDAWTPPAVRGQRHYGEAVTIIAKSVLDQGKKPWIFSAAANAASVRGLENAAFQRRYSLTRQRLLGWQRIKGQTPKINEIVTDEFSPQAGLPVELR